MPATRTNSHLKEFKKKSLGFSGWAKAWFAGEVTLDSLEEGKVGAGTAERALPGRDLQCEQRKEAGQAVCVCRVAKNLENKGRVCARGEGNTLEKVGSHWGGLSPIRWRCGQVSDTCDQGCTLGAWSWLMTNVTPAVWSPNCLFFTSLSPVQWKEESFRNLKQKQKFCSIWIPSKSFFP